MTFEYPLCSKPLSAVLFCLAILLGHSQASAQQRLSRSHAGSGGPQTGRVHPRFAYVCNEDSTIEIYTANPTNGALRPLTYINAGIYCGGSTMDASNKFLYVSNFVGNTISGFAANPKTGLLTPLASSLFPSGNEPNQIVLHPSGKFLYVTCVSDATVWGYSINTTTGALTPVPGNPVSVGSGPYTLAVTNSGKNLYVVNSNDSTLQGFSINTGTGQLTNQGKVSVGSIPESVTITPSGNFAYVTNRGDNNISGFSIGSNGNLTALAGSPFANGNLPPIGLAIEPTGKYAYTLNPEGGTFLNAFSINATTGALTLLNSAPYNSTTALGRISVDPSGKYVMLADGFGLEWWPINLVTGAISLGGTVASREYSLSLSFSTGKSPVAYKPKFLYLLNANTSPSVMSISQYSINPTTGLVTQLPGSPLGMSSFPIQVTLDPFGRFVYVSGGTFNSGTISAFTVNPVTGVLLPAPVPTYNLGGFADGIVEDPTGRFLYASVGPDFVAAYSIDPVTGTLTPVSGSPFSAGGNSVAITSGLAMDPLGRFLYVDNTNSNAQGTGNVAGFQINPSTGALTLMTSGFAENYPVAMVVDPYGQILFNVDEITGDIENYGISQSNGQLGGPFNEVLFPSGACPVGVTAHPTAPFLYVTVECSNTGWGLYGFKFDYPSMGFLTAIPGSPFFSTEDPESFTIDPSGKFAYASHFALGSFEAYKISAANGKLTSIAGSTVTTNDPAALAVLGVYK